MNKNVCNLIREFLKTMGFSTVSLFILSKLSKQGLIVQFMPQPVRIYHNYLRGVNYSGLDKSLLDAVVRPTAMVTAKHSLSEFGIGIWTDLIVNSYGADTGLSDQAADEVEDRYRG